MSSWLSDKNHQNLRKILFNFWLHFLSAGLRANKDLKEISEPFFESATAGYFKNAPARHRADVARAAIENNPNESDDDDGDEAGH